MNLITCPVCGAGYISGTYHRCGIGGNSGGRDPGYVQGPYIVQANWEFIKFDNNNAYVWLLNRFSGDVYKKKVIEETNKK